MDSFPTASVSGQHDWEWTRTQSERRARAKSQHARSTDPRTGAPPDRPWRSSSNEPTRRDPEALVAALERQERRLQAIIARYEYLLEEQHRQRAEATDDPSTGGHGTALLQAARRVIADW